MKPIDPKTRESVLKRAAAGVVRKNIARDLRISQASVGRIITGKP